MAEATLRRMLLLGFRSIAVQEVDLDNPTFVVGRNGSGKSNFADAFALLSEAMIAPLQGVIAQRGGFAAVSHRSAARGRPGNLSIKVELRNPDGDTAEADYWIDLRSRRGHDFEVATEMCGVKWVDGSTDSFVRKNVRGSTLWKSSVPSLTPAIEPNALALPLVGGDRRFRSTLGFLSNMRTYRIDPGTVRAMQEPDGGAVLRPDGRNAASVLREIQRRSPEDGSRVGQLLQSVVPGTVGVRPKRHGNRLTLEFTQGRAGTEPVKFEAFSMSDGTLRVLGLLLAAFQRPAPSVLVIEEPEASMHPGALGSILDVLQLASQTMQVVVTTHCPDILDAKWIEDRHLRILSSWAGSTRIARVSQAVRAALQEHLMGAGELLRSNALTSDEPADGDPEASRSGPEADPA